MEPTSPPRTRVRTYVALLRGINVGGRNRIAMADLRRVVESLGHADVRTYINSGNVIFSSDSRDTTRTGSAIEQLIAGELDVAPAVLVLSATELAAVAAANPFTDEADPKKVHVVFLPEVAGPNTVEAASAAEREAAAKGSRDRVRVVGRAAYLHTPDGLARSVLADLLNRRATGTGTARNWSTVNKLLALCAEE